MRASAYELDLASLKLSSGAGRSLELQVPIDALELGGERYEVGPRSVPVRIDVSRMTGGGYALKLAIPAALERAVHALSEAGEPEIEVRGAGGRRAGGGEELESPYVDEREARPGGVGARRVRAGDAREGALPRGLRGAVPGLRGRPERGRLRSITTSRSRIRAGRS